MNLLDLEILIRNRLDTDNLDESNSVYIFGKDEAENGSERKPDDLDAIDIGDIFWV